MKKIAFIGVKGGVGTTILSLSISNQIVNKKNNLIFIESNSHGDLSYFLGVNFDFSFYEILNHFKNSKQFEGKWIYPYSSFPGRFHFIFSRFLEKPDKEIEFLPLILNKIEKLYNYSVFDCGNTIDNTIWKILDISDLIFIIFSPDIVSLTQAKNIQNSFRAKYYPPQKYEFIVNKFDEENALSISEMENVLQKEVLFILPEEKTISLCVNLGFDIVKEKVSAHFLEKVKEIVEFLEGNIKREELLEKRKEKKKIFSIFKKKKKIQEEIKEKEEKEEIIKEEMVVIEEKKETDDKSLEEFRKLLHAHVIKEFTLSGESLVDISATYKNPIIKEKVEKIIIEKMDEFSILTDSQEKRKEFVEEMLKDILGYGPLEDYLQDPEITEIMVNGVEKIYIEKNGKIYSTDKKFINESQLRLVIERIVAPLGRRVDESVPLCDARLPDGSRVNITLPPISPDGPTITIRKFRKEPYTYKDLINFGTLSDFMFEFLKACVNIRKNIVIAGGTGSGKTTLLNVLSSQIPADERIITIEDTAELRLQQPHVVRLEARPPNIEGKGEITIRDLVRNALRMRPDRIIVGECRGAEAFDMLQAMNTGHDGSLTTIHANSPRDALYRIETMVLMAGMEIPVSAIRSYIASAINLIVFLERMKDGKRRVVKISEITGMEGNIITMQDIFIFKEEGITKDGKIIGKFMGMGVRSSFHEEFEIKGIPISPEIYFLNTAPVEYLSDKR